MVAEVIDHLKGPSIIFVVEPVPATAPAPVAVTDSMFVAVVVTTPDVNVNSAETVNGVFNVFVPPPEKVTLAIVKAVPLMVWASVLLKLCVPVLGVNVPLLDRLPPKLIVAAPVSLNTPPVFIVTLSVKVFAPVPPNVNVPVIDEVPATEKVKFEPIVKKPEDTVKLPATEQFASVCTG